MKKVPFLVLGLVLLLSSSLAFTYEVTPVKDSGFPGDTMKFEIEITNDGQFTDEINVATLAPNSELFPRDTVKIEPNETVRLNFSFVISKTKQANFTFIYEAKLIFYSRNTQQRGEEVVRVTVNPVKVKPEERLVNNIFFREVFFPLEFDPREPQILFVYVNNTIREDYHINMNYRITDSSGSDVMSKMDVALLISAGKDNELKIPVGFEPKQLPGEYGLEVEVYVVFEDVLLFLDRKSLSFVIKSYAVPLVDSSEKKSIIGKEYFILISNNGTEDYQTKLMIPMSYLEFLLIYQRTDDSFFEDGNLVLEMLIPPGETKRLSARTTFVPFFIAPFVLIGIGYAYIQASKKLSVSKILLEHEAGEGQLVAKLELVVKNLTSSDLHDVVVKEKLPAFVGSIGAFTTLKPKIHSKRGITWEIDQLSPKEERIITYKVKTKVGIVGVVSLPGAEVVFRDGKGREYSVSTRGVSFDAPDIGEEKKGRKPSKKRAEEEKK